MKRNMKKLLGIFAKFNTIHDYKSIMIFIKRNSHDRFISKSLTDLVTFGVCCTYNVL